MKKSIFAALTLACVLLAGCNKNGNTVQPGDGGAVYPQSTADESTEQSTDNESSEEPESTDSESSAVAKPTDTDFTPAPPADGYKTLECTFPASERGKTEYSAKIFDIEPFTVSANFPEDWTIKVIPEEGIEADGDFSFHGLGFSPVLLMSGDTVVGRMDYMTFDLDNYEGSMDNIPHRAVYNWIMLGNVISWDGGYTEYLKFRNVCSARTRIYVKDLDESEYPHGILAYRILPGEDHGVYISIEFVDVNIDEEILNNIVTSIVFTDPSEQ